MPCRKSTSSPSPATVSASRGAGSTKTVSRGLFRLRSRNSDGTASALAILPQINDKVLRRAPDHFIAFFHQLSLPKVRFVYRFVRVLVDSSHGLGRRARRDEEPEPG